MMFVSAKTTENMSSATLTVANWYCGNSERMSRWACPVIA
jgi:hypothetical protein